MVRPTGWRVRQVGRRLRSASVGALVTLATTACSYFAGPLNSLLIPDDGYRAETGIAYGDGPRRQLDIYVPREADGKRDVVIFFYGGSWKSGSRSDYQFVGEAFTSRDMIAVIPDYRIYPNVQFPAFIDDGAAAIAWVQANIADFGGDPQRIFLAGHSAGAHIGAMLSAAPEFVINAGGDPGAIQGFVGLAGPYAFEPDRIPSVRAIFQDPAVDIPSQPVAYVDGNEPPVLLMHGTDDDTVKASNMFALGKDIERMGGKAKVVEVADTSHIGLVLALARPFQEEGGVMDTIAAWISETSCEAHRPPAATAQTCASASGA